MRRRTAQLPRSQEQLTAALRDVVLGGYLTEMTAAIRTRPLCVVALAPRPAIVDEREGARRLARGKTAYKPGDEGPAELDAVPRRETPGIGLRLDTSEQTLEQTVEELLARVWTQARAQPASCLTR